MIFEKDNFLPIAHNLYFKISVVTLIIFILFSPASSFAEESICDSPNETWIAFSKDTKTIIPVNLKSVFKTYYKNRLQDGGICIELKKAKALTCKLMMISSGNNLKKYGQSFYNDEKNQKNMYLNFDFFILDEYDFFFRLGSFDTKFVGKKMLSMPTLELIAKPHNVDTRIYGKKNHRFINNNLKLDYEEVRYLLYRDSLMYIKFYNEGQEAHNYKCTLTNPRMVIKNYNNLNQRFIDYTQSKSKKNKF